MCIRDSRKACQKQGRHKKQTGGHGQFGDVIINFEPCDSEQVVFEEKVDVYKRQASGCGIPKSGRDT